MFPRAGYYFIALLGLVVIGFWQTYFSRAFNDSNAYVHAHAFSMLLWLAMLISQAFLIRYKKYDVHRTIGKFSYLLVPVIIVSLILLAHHQIVSGKDGISAGRRYILFLQLSLLLIFVVAYVMAMLNRRTPLRHARFMICTGLTVIDPAVARVPLDLPPLPFDYQFITFGLVDLILLILIVAERKQQRGRDVFPAMLGLFLIFQVLNLTATESLLWRRFAIWFASLPLS